MINDKCPHKCKKGKVYLERIGDFVDCPVCRNIEEVVKQTPEGTGFYEKLRVPKAYEGVTTSSVDTLFTANLPFTSASIAEVKGIMHGINNAIYNEEILALSCYIHTSNMVDNRIFVYGAQKLALEKTLSVVPYISLNVLYSLQRVGDFTLTTLKDLTYKDATGLKDVPPNLINALDGYRLVQDTDLTYYDYITADICFLEATANTSERGWTALADILGERTKKGLPTYVMGYWSSKVSDFHAKGLRYLVQSSAVTRLDLLTPYEVKSGKQNFGTELNRGVPNQTIKPTAQVSNVGVTMNDILG